MIFSGKSLLQFSKHPTRYILLTGSIISKNKIGDYQNAIGIFCCHGYHRKA